MNDIDPITSIEYSNPHSYGMFNLKVERRDNGYHVSGTRVTGLLDFEPLEKNGLSYDDAIHEARQFALACYADGMLNEKHVRDVNDLLLALV